MGAGLCPVSSMLLMLSFVTTALNETTIIESKSVFKDGRLVTE